MVRTRDCLTVRAVVTVGLVLLICAPAWAQEQSVQSFPLNGYKRALDGQWQGIRYASDGNVYFGSSTHSANHGAAFFKYDPRTGQITMLAEDLTLIAGENPQVSPLGKLHSDIVEANGWLYFSFHFSSERPGAYDVWSGAYVFGYELATGTFRNYGVVHPRYTNYAGIGVDPARNYLYVFVTGEYPQDVSYIYRIDTVTGARTNLGQVGQHFDSSFWMFVDRRGDVWFSVATQDGALFRVRGATGAIEVFPDALPPMYRWDTESPVGNQSLRWIMWMQPLDGDRAVFTLGWDGGMLYEFDASKPIAQAFRTIKHIGYSDLGLAIGDNRVFYYQRANRGYGQQEHQDFHLLSISLDEAAGYPITDHGLLKDQDGRLAWRLPGMATDGHSKVFMIGDWWTIPGDLGTLRYRWVNGGETYQQLPRGQFFAVADVVIDNTAPALALLSVSPSYVVGGTTASTHSVGLNVPAHAGGYLVTLASSDPSVATVPDSVTVPPGATAATFSIVTHGVAADQAVTVTASDAHGDRTATLNVLPAVLSSLTVTPTANAGTPSASNWASLTGGAPPAGATIELSSSNPAVASVPTSVSIFPDAASSLLFTIDTGPVSTATVVTITARYGGITRTANLTVHPVALSSLTVSTTSVNAGSATAANRVALTRPAPPGGAAVALASSHPAVTVMPASVVVPPGQTISPDFTIEGNPVSVATTVTITASFGGVTRTATLTVQPVIPSHVSLSPTTVDAGTPTAANRVVLTRPAPPAGAVIALSSSHPAVAAVPGSITIPAGTTTSPAFTIDTSAVAATTQVTVSASYGGVTRSAVLTVYPVALSSITLSSTSVNAGSPLASNRVALTRPTPPGGAVVNLTSSHPALAAVPASVTLTAGATTSPLFTIATNAVTANTPVTITASYAGVTRSATLTLYPVQLGALTLSPSSTDAGTPSTQNRVTLGRPAPPGGAVVTLSSSHPAIASVPSSVGVPAAATQSPPFSIATSAVAAATSVTITASYGGVTRTATLTVYPVTLSSLTLYTTSVNAGTPVPSNRVALTRMAPPGGASVSLSSSHPAVAGVPASIVVPAGTTSSPPFTITTGAVDTTTAVTITSSFGGVTRTATLTIYPVVMQSVVLYPTSLKGGASSASHRVTLTRPAPPGGATVLLTSSDPARVQLPASVFVPAGSTNSATFTTTTSAVSAATPIAISASFGGVTRTATLTLTP